ncbi:MAG: TatD family hydrolase [Chromatiales bacterium]|nr:TatD family hydrolase [Chromatiales bacterium]
MQLIDTHSHFDDNSFDHDREQALARAQEAGVSTQIIPAIAFHWWPRLRTVCQTHAGLHPAYGLHPMFMADHKLSHLEELAKWIEQEQPVAVGECGLDFYISEPDKPGQQRIFEGQLELAQQYKLPVIIHARRSVEEVINTLRRYPGISGVLHSYSGSFVQAERLIAMGFMLSFGGPITYSRAKRLRQLVAELPLESILLETDTPDQPDSQHRGERNEPAYLIQILETVSELRNESSTEIAAATTRNAQRLFGI